MEPHGSAVLPKLLVLCVNVDLKNFQKRYLKTEIELFLLN